VCGLRREQERRIGGRRNGRNRIAGASAKVSVMTLKLCDFHHELVSNGKLSARRYADLHFETEGVIAMIAVKNGDRVAQGHTLATLTPFRLSNKTAQALDALERAKLDMQDVLIGQGYAPDDTFRTPSPIMQLARTKSGYNQSLAQYELAVYEEEHATLKAPFDGIVANLFAKTYQQASPSEAFCTIFDPRSLETSFTVLESELPLIHTGDKVVVTPFAAPEAVAEGRISEINPLVDENGMVRVKATVVSSARLFEGMNVRVSIRRSLPDQLVVPKEAVVLRSGKQVIFTYKDGVAVWNYITTSLENATEYALVNDGHLKEGDVVITSGNINLAHEAPVEIQ
jgi:RND family efflux transporter MFP subunit